MPHISMFICGKELPKTCYSSVIRKVYKRAHTYVSMENKEYPDGLTAEDMASDTQEASDFAYECWRDSQIEEQE